MGHKINNIVYSKKKVCSICNKVNCNGIGNGMTIPDHEPSWEDAEPTLVDGYFYCDLCGEPLKETSEDFNFKMVVTGYFYYDGDRQQYTEYHDDDDIHYHQECHEKIIKPLHVAPKERDP